MPRNLRLKDCETLYYSYFIGQLDGICCYANAKKSLVQIDRLSGSNEYEKFGALLNYNTVICFSLDNDTRFIDENTKLWLGKKPFSSSDEADFNIKLVGREKDGLFQVYCESVVTSLMPIWYVLEGKIYNTNVYLDLNTLTALIPKNMFLPIDNETKIWYREPEDINTTSAGLSLVNSYDENGSVKLVFEVIQNAET